MDKNTHQELVELIEGQRAIIARQLKIITKLINENAEKEEAISVLIGNKDFT